MIQNWHRIGHHHKMLFRLSWNYYNVIRKGRKETIDMHLYVRYTFIYALYIYNDNNTILIPHQSVHLHRLPYPASSPPNALEIKRMIPINTGTNYSATRNKRIVYYLSSLNTLYFILKGYQCKFQEVVSKKLTVHYASSRTNYTEVHFLLHMLLRRGYSVSMLDQLLVV